MMANGLKIKGKVKAYKYTQMDLIMMESGIITSIMDKEYIRGRMV